MSCNKRMIDIERKINNFFASEEFKTLVLKHGAKENSYAPETFTIYNNSHIEEILNDVNNKIHEIEESISIYVTRDLLFCTSSTGIYMEMLMPDKEIVREYIGVLMIHDSFPSQNNKWMLRFYDKYICHSTSDWYSGAKISYVSDVKRKIFYENKKQILSNCKKSIKGTNENIRYYEKEKSELVKRKKIVEGWKYKEDSANGDR
jgi:hypothetical protein